MYEVTDLTHTLDSSNPTWEGDCGFSHQTLPDGEEFGFCVQRVEMRAGAGTHMDAPLHCIRGGKDIAQIPLEKLLVPIVKIDISAHCASNPDAQLTLDTWQAFGDIPEQALVLVHTGWDQHWQDKDTYRSEDEQGRKHFPTVHPAVADRWLEQSIAGIGIDTLSPDPDPHPNYAAPTSFPVHKKILGAGAYIIENICGAASLPDRGAWAIALPLKAAGGAESAIRLLAFTPSS